MRGTKFENMKNAAIAILLGYIAATSLEWRDVICQIGGGYIVAQIIWVFLVAYDELLRKRRHSRRNHKRTANM